MPFDFEANNKVDILEGVVPEKYHFLYAEVDGGYEIADGAKAIVADYVGTTKALDRAKADKKAAGDESAARRQSLAAYDAIMDAIGLEEDARNADGLKAHIDGLISQVKGGKDIQVNIDKIKKDADRRIEELTASKDADLQRMQGTLSRHLIGDVASRALADAKGAVDLLMPHIVQHCRVVQDGEDYVVRVVDGQGDFRSNGAGGWMGVRDLVAEMKESSSFSRAFESEAPSGSAVPPGGARRQAPPSQTEKTAIDKISSGLDKFRHRAA